MQFQAGWNSIKEQVASSRFNEIFPAPKMVEPLTLTVSHRWPCLPRRRRHQRRAQYFLYLFIIFQFYCPFHWFQFICILDILAHFLLVLFQWFILIIYSKKKICRVLLWLPFCFIIIFIIFCFCFFFCFFVYPDSFRCRIGQCDRLLFRVFASIEGGVLGVVKSRSGHLTGIASVAISSIAKRRRGRRRPPLSPLSYHFPLIFFLSFRLSSCSLVL